MRDVQIFGIIMAIITLAAMYELIRRQNIKEKYAGLWLLAAVGLVIIAIYPHVLDLAATVTGVSTGPNLLFLVGGLVVTLVCVHLSVEVSRAEDRSRALAEEIGLLRLELEKRLSTSARPVDGED